MHQTTYGATHKIKTLSREEYVKILTEESDCYFNVSEENTVYNNSLTIKDSSVNYLNSITSSNSIFTFRKLLEKEFDDCELFSKGSGSIFLSYVFDYIKKNRKMFTTDVSDDEFEDSLEYLRKELELVKNNSFRLSKSIFLDYLKNFNQKSVDDFLKIVNNSKISSSIFIEKSNYEKTRVRKREDCVFNISFDNDYLLNREKVEFKNFKFVIIDGFIDSVSEIHHLLHKSSETKQPYVLICKGMREEVKYTIVQNLIRKTINLFPICLSINEENVNITSDFAAVLNGDVINHLMGDTISAAVRRDLKTGNKITISKNKIAIEPVDRERLERHILFLKKRVEDAEVEINKQYLLKRIKCVTADRIEVYIKNKSDYEYSRDLIRMIDSFKRFQKGCFIHESSSNTSEPSSVISMVIKKALSFLKIIYNIRLCIILERED